jgi:5-methyltetrahydrofolate--homocysteine methyltransferase
MARNFRQRLAENKPLIFDGGMGTVLFQKGISNVLAELLNLQQPEIIYSIHKEYIDAGADIVETNTFNASAIKLEELGLGDKLIEINTNAVQLARRAAGENNFVAGSIGPSGKLLEPLGPFTFDQIYESYKAQAVALANAGVDLFMLETISDLQEMRAALLATKDAANLPVICSMTFNADGRTLTGTDMYTAAITLSELGADVISTNCSIGPDGVLNLYRQFHKKLAEADRPLMVMPNAGLPVLEDGKAVYKMTPDEFAEIMDQFRQYGVTIYGGCCGTTPSHIQAVAKKVKGQKITFQPHGKEEIYFTSRNKVLKLSDCKPFLKIAEALNPTARKVFNQELREGKEDFLRDQARNQTAKGAHLLDINVGVPEMDQAKLMKRCVQVLLNVTDTPLCIDSDDPVVIEAALKNYPGLAMVNSVNGKQKALDKILPLAKRYGARLIALALDEQGIPNKAEDRLKIVEKICAKAKEIGYDTDKLFFDGLVMTLASEPQAGLETLKVTELIAKRGLKTSLGVSNVSFGLPQRKYVNNVFLDLLIQKGLSAGIISVETFKYLQGNYEESEEKALAVIQGQDYGAKSYIEYMNKHMGVIEMKKASVAKEGLPAIYEAVINGEEGKVLDLIEKELIKTKAQDIIDQALLPGLDQVGQYYSAGKYFLPQMIASANTMKLAFERLKKEFPKGSAKVRGTAVICTVEGDIHDIGKNIVSLMLENNGFTVIDLGKDVKTADIVAAVKKHNANVVLLSALLTTTMLNMREVKKALEKENIHIPVMLGGAVVTSDYAESMGAHYSSDAAQAIHVVKRVISADSCVREDR